MSKLLNGKYRKIAKIGQGTFGQIYLCARESLLEPTEDFFAFERADRMDVERERAVSVAAGTFVVLKKFDFG